jgi:hypothetical protein
MFCETPGWFQLIAVLGNYMRFPGENCASSKGAFKKKFEKMGNFVVDSHSESG